ncbi:MAG: hypothetical protein F6K19_05115 [Cyanothece sp. SIO1E1]|nr:hypothetical protein [Cyanothece sp. SIO1E1]
MVTAENLVYSRAAASRILGLLYRRVNHLKVFNNAVWVWVPGKRPTFLSKKLFEQHFHEWRMQQAQSLTVMENGPGTWTVYNPKRGTCYRVSLEAQEYTCECEDFKSQAVYLEQQPLCKHCWAVVSCCSSSKAAA